MHLPAVLSIDFGSTYTKIGYRAEIWAHTVGTKHEPAQVMLSDESALIPTLAISSGRKDQPWIFGAEAANLNPSPSMEVYSNWKATLFNRDNNPTTAGSIIIAQAFFRWLRERVEMALPGLENLHVRVMVPAFDDFEILAEVMRRCMQLAGWKMPIEVCTEPHANAIGLMTRGKNCYRTGTKSSGVDFMSMYDFNSSYIQTARRFVLSEHGTRELRVAILDIGSFTTDLALLVFDVGSGLDGDGLKTINQRSHEVGAHTYLTEPLWKELGEKYHADFSATSFAFREEIKRTIFAGQSYTVMLNDQPRQIGGEHDAEIVGRLVGDFAQAIWQKVGSSIHAGKVSVVYLTGGGSQVPMLVESLNHLGASFTPVNSPSAPAEETEPRKIYFTPWLKSQEKLERIATCIGGSSIIPPVSLPKAPIGAPAPPITRKATTKSAIRSCSCGGLNPDCGICSGSGYVNARQTS